MNNLRKIRVLVADSDHFTVKIIKDTLMSFGFVDISVAFNIKNAQELLNGKPFGFMICDWILKDGDGIEMVKNLRKNSKSPNRYVPVIMATGKGAFSDVTQARDAGITEFMLKPFSVDSLRSKIIEIVDNPRNFIISRNFVGPDRRRRKVNIDFKERRKPSKKKD